MKHALAALLAAIGLATASAQALPEVALGRIERLPPIASTYVDPRPVDVWLPADYSPARRYDVLYMHDGQMLFDASKSWNHQAWDLHLALDRLVKAGRIPDTIVVGVWNNDKLRHSEYFPEKFLPFLPEPLRRTFVDQALQGRPRADAYLRHLVQEIKPAIDARYPTRPGPDHTHLMGSSMGGLISIYAMSEYPQVFGSAACLSTHWVGSFEPNAALPLAAFNYLLARLPDPATHRLYMDHGTVELDALYAPYQAFVDQIVRDRGYAAANSLTRVYEGQGHNERAWAARMDVVLPFLLGSR